jgi:hypothetical protein
MAGVTAPTRCLVSRVPLTLSGLSALLSAPLQHTEIFRALVDRPLHYNYVITLYLLFCPAIAGEFASVPAGHQYFSVPNDFTPAPVLAAPHRIYHDWLAIQHRNRHAIIPVKMVH